MSRLDELIAKLCPDRVEYKTLGQAVSIERGKRLVRDQLADTGLYPVYQNSMTPLGYHTEYNYPANTTFIIGAGAAGEIGFSQVDFGRLMIVSQWFAMRKFLRDIYTMCF